MTRSELRQWAHRCLEVFHVSAFGEWTLLKLDTDYSVRRDRRGVKVTATRGVLLKPGERLRMVIHGPLPGQTQRPASPTP